MVKKFLTTTTRTSKRPSVAFTPQKPNILQRATAGDKQMQGITTKKTLDLRLNNRRIPLNPNAPPFKPRAGNFGTKRIVGG